MKNTSWKKQKYSKTETATSKGYSPHGLEFLLPDVQLLLHLQPVALVFVADPDETLLLFLASLWKSRGSSELTTGRYTFQ